MSPELITVISVIISGISAGAVAVVTAIVNGRKDEIESLRKTLQTLKDENERISRRMQEIEESANEENQHLRQQVKTLQTDLETLQCRLGYLESENADYRAMLQECGLTEDELLRGGKKNPIKSQ